MVCLWWCGPDLEQLVRECFLKNKRYERACQLTATPPPIPLPACARLLRPLAGSSCVWCVSDRVLRDDRLLLLLDHLGRLAVFGRLVLARTVGGVLGDANAAGATGTTRRQQKNESDTRTQHNQRRPLLALCLQLQRRVRSSLSRSICWLTSWWPARVHPAGASAGQTWCRRVDRGYDVLGVRCVGVVVEWMDCVRRRLPFPFPCSLLSSEESSLTATKNDRRHTQHTRRQRKNTRENTRT